MIDRTPDRIRSRIGSAAAVFTHASKRIVLVADKASFDDADAVIAELRTGVSAEKSTHGT